MIFNQTLAGGGGSSSPATHTLNIDTSYLGSGSIYIEIYDKPTDTWLRNPSQITYESDELLLLKKEGTFNHSFYSSDGSEVYSKIYDTSGRFFAFRMPDADTNMSFAGSGSNN